MAQFPSNAAELLLQSLNYSTAQHKPYAWRLLAEFYGRVSVAQRETLEALIREIGNSGTTALQREMARYVDRSKLIGLQR